MSLTFGSSVVLVAPSPALTGTTMKPAVPSEFPDPNTDGPFSILCWPAAASDPDDDNSEMIKVLSEAGGIWTVLRGFEGTTPIAITIGDPISYAVTVGQPPPPHPPDYGRELINWAVIPNDTLDHLLFSSIPQTYKDLLVLYKAHSVSGADDLDWVYCYLNSDWGSNSYVGTWTGVLDGVEESGLEVDTSAGWTAITGTSTGGNYWGWGEIYIPDYKDFSKFRDVIRRGGMAYLSTGRSSFLNSIYIWRNNADPVTSIYLECEDLFKTGSVFYLYGIPEA